MSRSLLDQIEQDALNTAVKLADVLRKCIALGGRAGSEELRSWASRELRGYGADDQLPEYRIIGAPIALDGVTANAIIKGQQIAPSSLPDFVQENVSETLQLRQPIGQIEELASSHASKNESVKLLLPMAADIARLMNAQADDPFQSIQSLYWMVSPSALFAIADQVRTSLVELVAELRATMPKDQAIPSAETAANAVHVAIHGGRRHKVSVTAAQSATSSEAHVAPSIDSSWWTPWRKVGAVVVGLATVAAAVFALLEWLGG